MRASFAAYAYAADAGTKTRRLQKSTNAFINRVAPLVPFCGLRNNFPNLPLAQNLFLKRISKLKLLVRALSLLVDACSYCATKESRSETRYSSARIWFGAEVPIVE